MSAAAGDSPDNVRLLLAKGAKLEDKDNDGQTALHWAVLGDGGDIAEASAGDADLVHLLLVRGADIQAKDKKGRTALQLAVSHRKTEVVKLLREKGAH
jgi:serine/threonine-protein phosphatase 6 regulatory ankyrin repeat subunit A/serine/threonine-protein phosphatase 6 regulatory ankyrin repeat subunit B